MLADFVTLLDQIIKDNFVHIYLWQPSCCFQHLDVDVVENGENFLLIDFSLGVDVNHVVFPVGQQFSS